MPRAQRIAFVSPRYPSGSTVGGAETLLRNLAGRLATDGRDVEFLTTCATSHVSWENDRPPGEEADGPLRVRYFPVNTGRNLDAFFRAQARISAGITVSESEEREWLDNGVNSDALVAHLAAPPRPFDRVIVGPYLFGLTARAAAVCPERTILLPCLHDEPFAYLGAIRALFKSVRSLMFNSEPEQRLAERLYDLDPSRGGVVGMGIEPFDVTRGTFASAHRLPREYLLYCGRREPLKGTPMLIDYLAAFRARTGRDIALVLTGSGPVEVPASLRASVVDLGFVPEADKHGAMADALAFVHPSRNESFGIVLLEAWMARTPALVTAYSDVLRDHCETANGGLWFRTYPEFEESLQLLLDQPALRRAMGEAGHAYVTNRYAWDRVEARLKQAVDGH